MKKALVCAGAFLLAASLAEAGPGTTANPRVKIETTKGEIVLELFPKAAPKTVANFLQYVKDGFYNGTIFHRVIRNFMIQGGGLTQDMTEKPTRPPIVNEADNGLKNSVGTIAMGQMPGNPNSATSQFYINVKDNTHLDFSPRSPGYCVFGKVISGMDVVTAIENEPTSNTVPTTPIVMTNVTVMSGKSPAAKGKKAPGANAATSAPKAAAADSTAKNQ
jgi:peptidyl-prolyl cis-trans isomerase A (cyclophilin A)